MQVDKENLYRFINGQAEKCKILVVGDVMLDKYYYGQVTRISPEAPVPVARVLKEKETLGGAANVAHNLALLGCQTALAGFVGADAHRQSLLEKLDARNIDHVGLICMPRPTTTKLRIIGGHQQMLRLDFEETSPAEAEYQQKLLEYIDSKLAEGIDSLIISDYGKGLCTPDTCQYIIKKCQAYQVPVVVDPKGNDWHKYTGADYITPNLKEINEILAAPIANEDQVVKKAAQHIKRKYSIRNILATRSECGLSLISQRKVTHIPTMAQEVFDVSGAGDTVIAVFALALAGKIKPEQAAYLANLAASVVVAKLGTYAVSKDELLDKLS